ncbi:MAG: ABC transporter ATP-binding protein [Gammaproteobacteria bacterium]|nr:ABC transporter ATP-binding protein [Gammaproteobacteria bacterium]
MTERSNLLEVEKLGVTYGSGRHRLVAVDDVSFALPAGRTLGLVGESGCGKSSLARAILRLEECTGDVRFCGQDWLALDGGALRQARRQLQAVFQDPLASLDPGLTVRQSLLEPLRVHRPHDAPDEQQQRVTRILRRVGLDEEYLDRYPHELSGGQCQRVGIGRALVSSPALVVLDEPVSALDMSIRGQILELLASLQQDSGLAFLFIAHDMTAVRYLCHDVMVMYRGRIVEAASREQLFEHPAHPYTRELLRAVLPPDRHTQPPPDARPIDVAAMAGAACPFAPRCRFATPQCEDETPALRDLGGGHQVACHHAEALPGWS